jgi:transposase InsO family protein
LIHLDLKSFPIESYHKFQYVIVFYDDFSSNAWTISLKKKSDAVKAATDWLMYVANSHSSHVKSWMSDAGGEYKSKQFDDLLRSMGIKVHTSAPHTHQQNG